MKSLLATLLLAAAAVPAAAGPDFVTTGTPHHALAASDGRQPILPADDVVFEHNSANLIDSAQTQILTAARWIKEHPGTLLVLEGHANSIGSAAYNQDLAMRRAELVRQHLIGNGVPSDRLMIVVFGESGAQPVASPIDRRVVMYASREPAQTIVRKSLERGTALSTAYTRKGVLFTERHGARGARGARASGTVASR
ncbi:hypothetical protein BH11MYX3_BH11MYX3_25400 [soil metagenome]